MTDASTNPTPEPTTNPDAPGAAPEPADTIAGAPADPPADTAPDEAGASAAALASRLASVEAAADDLRRMLERSERERAIDRELLASGVIDLDAARALVEEGAADGATIVEAVARLRERRPLLFTARARALRATSLPASDTPPAGPLAEAAEAARESGDRRALLDYLRLRRA